MILQDLENAAINSLELKKGQLEREAIDCPEKQKENAQKISEIEKYLETLYRSRRRRRAWQSKPIILIR